MESKKNTRFFVIVTYGVFYILLGLCGLSMALGAPKELISKFAPIICSWASFLVLMLWSKRFYPQKTRIEFIKDMFRDIY